jgi:hypothetical protein
MIIKSKRLHQMKLFGVRAAHPNLFKFPALFSGNKLLVRKITSDVGSVAPAFGAQAHPQVMGVSSKTKIITFQLTASKQTAVVHVMDSGESVELMLNPPRVVLTAIGLGNSDESEPCFCVASFAVREIFQ